MLVSHSDELSEESLRAESGDRTGSNTVRGTTNVEAQDRVLERIHPRLDRKLGEKYRNGVSDGALVCISLEGHASLDVIVTELTAVSGKD